MPAGRPSPLFCQLFLAASSGRSTPVSLAEYLSVPILLRRPVSPILRRACSCATSVPFSLILVARCPVRRSRYQEASQVVWPLLPPPVHFSPQPPVVWTFLVRSVSTFSVACSSEGRVCQPHPKEPTQTPCGILFATYFPAADFMEGVGARARPPAMFSSLADAGESKVDFETRQAARKGRPHPPLDSVSGQPSLRVFFLIDLL